MKKTLLITGLLDADKAKLVRNFRKATLSFVLGVGLASVGSASADTVFSDSFGTSAGTSFDTSGAIGTSSTWSVAVSAGDYGAKIDGGQLTLTNDASGTANANGTVFAYTPTTSFASPYRQVLTTNLANVEWDFNMQQIRPDPAGYGAGSYGAAFILAGSSTSANNTGNGYAIVYGQSGSTDPVRLVRYTGGLSGTLTNIITATSVLTDVGADFLSIRVVFNPLTDQWSLFGRNDSGTFNDPLGDTLSSLGTAATDSTYTGTSLGFMGAFWGGSTTANQTALFDNITVLASVPEPREYAFAICGLIGVVIYLRRRQRAER